MGDVEYIDKGGIILNIYDSDNSASDKFIDDFYNEENEDYMKTTAEHTVGVPNIHLSTPSQPEFHERKVINRHIPHDQEVEHFKHNYTIGLEEDPILDSKEVISQYYISSTFT